MVSLGSALYAIEPNHGELVHIFVNGNIMSNFGFGIPDQDIGQIVRIVIGD